jgi:hypothetical protein
VEAKIEVRQTKIPHQLNMQSRKPITGGAELIAFKQQLFFLFKADQGETG